VWVGQIDEKGLRSLSRGGLTPNESTNQALQPGTDISIKPVQCQVLGSFENAAESAVWMVDLRNPIDRGRQGNGWCAKSTHLMRTGHANSSRCTSIRNEGLVSALGGLP
jgi:hypothetical protein